MVTHYPRKTNLGTQPKANTSQSRPDAKDYERMWRNIEAKLDKQDADRKEKKRSTR